MAAKTAVQVVGIDPGLDGGIARMTIDHGAIVAIPMPVKKKPGSKTKRELNVDDIASYLSVNVGDIYCCVLEQVHAMPKQGVTSMFNFGLGYGMLIGVLRTLHIPTHYIPPTVWKKSILPGTKRDKEAAIAYCKKRYPSVSLMLPRHRTPHDGMADALCLAEYARKLLLPGD
jgi:crossover junction endodeoxyribonuclease RuvC